MKNMLGHHGMDQLVNEDTWSRTVNGVYISSRIDHVYTTIKSRINNLKLINNAYSDHEMVEFEFELKQSEGRSMKPKASIWRRNWKKYSLDRFIK